MNKIELFDNWNNIKKRVEANNFIIKFQQRHIIFMKTGANIGFEQDGKGEEFLRPILVYKKFNNRIFLGIPLTTKEKYDKFHFQFEYKKNKKSFAMLSQLRLYDIKRAKYYDGKISRKSFYQLQHKLLNLIVTPFQKEGECTKAICKHIITQNNLNVKINILVTGSNGQLGSEIKNLTQNLAFNIQNFNFYFTDKNNLDITNRLKIEEFIIKNKIDIIINCAAYTAVDKAQTEEELANTINNLAVKYLAKISKERDIALIHISTDYVFDGKNYKPYIEADPTNPQSIYGKTKLAGEKAILSIDPPNSLIIRTSWLYSEFGNNFVKTILRLGKEKDSLKVVYDQIGTPTYAKDLAKVILQIIQNSKLVRVKQQLRTKEDKIQNSTQIYHYSNEGVCSWFDFAKEIIKMANIKCKVKPIQTKEYPTPADRPHYSLLNKAKIKNDFGIDIPYWKDSLYQCLVKLGEANDHNT